MGATSTDPESGAGGATSGTGLTGEHSSQVLGVQSSADRVSLEMRDDEGVRLSGRGVGVDGMGAGHAGRVKFAWWTTRLDVPAGFEVNDSWIPGRTEDLRRTRGLADSWTRGN